MSEISFLLRYLNTHLVQNTPGPLVPTLETISKQFVDLLDLVHEFRDRRLAIDASFGCPGKTFTGHDQDVCLGHTAMRGHLLVDGGDDGGPEGLSGRGVGFNAFGEFLIKRIIC